MPFKFPAGSLLMLLMIHLCLVPVQAGEGKPGNDNQAKVQLAEMAKKLAGAKQFSVSMLMNYDVVQESGQKIQFSEVRDVLIDRPNHLRVDARQSDGDTGGLVFDGKVLTLVSF